MPGYCSCTWPPSGGTTALQRCSVGDGSTASRCCSRVFLLVCQLLQVHRRGRSNTRRWWRRMRGARQGPAQAFQSRHQLLLAFRLDSDLSRLVPYPALGAKARFWRTPCAMRHESRRGSGVGVVLAVVKDGYLLARRAPSSFGSRGRPPHHHTRLAVCVLGEY
jgi:hypothetical protein